MQLKVKKLMMDMEFEGTTPPLRYPTNTLRGGFGYAFRKVACPFRKRDCNGCLALGQCVYSYMFETRPEGGEAFMGGVNRVPHPFTLHCEQVADNPNMMRAELTLIGKGIDFAVYFVLAMRELGTAGLGKKRERFRISRVTETDTGRVLMSSEDGNLARPGEPERYPVRQAGSDADELVLDLMTPLRLKHGGRIMREPGFRAIAGALLRRASSLCVYHGDGNPGLDYRGLAELANEVELVRDETRWTELTRYSTRQGSRMKLGGMVGRAFYRGPVGPFTDLLRLGAAVGLGKACTFGFGRISAATQSTERALQDEGCNLGKAPKNGGKVALGVNECISTG